MCATAHFKRNGKSNNGLQALDASLAMWIHLH
jgi:hypothetical protein